MNDLKKEMFGKINTKINSKIEEILNKNEIDYNDFMILSTKLTDLKNDFASEKMSKFGEIFSPIK